MDMGQMPRCSANKAVTPRRLELAAKLRAFLRRPSTVAALAIFAVQGVAGTSARADAVTDVSAKYAIAFNGVSIGKFNFKNTVRGRTYTVNARANVKLLFGALTWKGVFNGTGQIGGSGVEPRQFSQRFDSKRRLAFRTKRRRKTAEIAFRGGDVVDTKLEPPRKTRNRAPLRPEHLKDVLDPISALVALSQANRRDPCRARLPVFEGRQRLDLRLSAKGRRRIADRRGGQVRGYVCRVEAIQIGGHKLSEADSAAARGPDAIEIVLRPVPGADILIPHSVSVQSGYGTATITAERVNITTRGNAKIALTN